MKYEVIIENSAERDLLEILTYISETLLEPVAAKRIYLSIKEQAQSLDHMPFRYNVIQEEPYCQMGVRRMPVENYTAFYVVDETGHTVHIFRILYNRREWQSLI